MSQPADFTFDASLASIYLPVEVEKHATYIALEPGTLTHIVTPWDPDQLMTMSGSYYKVLENALDNSKFYGVVASVFEATHALKRGERHGTGVWVRTARVRAIQAKEQDVGKVVKTVHGLIVETETPLANGDWIVEQFESPASEIMVLRNDNFRARYMAAN